MTNCKISPWALGMSLGILWGASMLLMGLLAHYTSYGNQFVVAMGSVYIWSDASIKGSIIGGAMGFVDAFIGGVILAWIYNCFAGRCCKKDEKCE